MRSILLLPALLSGALAADTPSFKEHYLWSLGYATLGAVVGGSFLAVATDPPARAGAFGLGFLGGELLGAAWGATTVSPGQEEGGSLGLSLVGGILSASAGGLSGYWMGSLATDDQAWALGLGVTGTLLGLPLGAVAFNRWAAGGPRLGIWLPESPHGDRPMGLRATWSLQ